MALALTQISTIRNVVTRAVMWIVPVSELGFLEERLPAEKKVGNTAGVETKEERGRTRYKRNGNKPTAPA
jgi:hypothetical protein